MSRLLVDKKRQDINKIIIKAMLEDKEVAAGGIFQKEDYYMKKYGLTSHEIAVIEFSVYAAINGFSTKYDE